MQTRFNPAQHGFHFSNNDITWSFATASGHQLCGGMSFASLDFYFAGQPIPPDTTAPAEHAPLHNYIFRRQFDAHGFALPYFTGRGAASAQEKFNGSLTTQFGLLRPYLDQGQPFPILLDGGASPSLSHWVVAIGYDTQPGGAGGLTRLHVYDNNQPNVVRQLTPNRSTHRWSLIGGGSFNAFVVGTNYRYLRPSPEEMERPANAGQVLRGTSIGGHRLGSF